MNGNDLAYWCAQKLAAFVLFVFALAAFVIISVVIACVCYGDERVCTPDGCFIVKTPSAPTGFNWEKYDSDHFFLYKDGKCVGQWVVGDAVYYPFDGVRTLSAAKPPIDPPGREAVTAQMREWCTNGVARDRLAVEESLSHCGRQIHPGLIQAAFDGTLTDDSDKGYFVVIAKDENKRNAVLADWKKLPTEFTSRYNVWLAPPDHFSMQDRFAGKPRFFTEGDPTVVLEKKDGTVLFRRPQANQTYRSTDMQDLLKSDPSYKPSLDPGGPAVSPASHLSAQTVAAIVVALLGGAILLFRRKP